MTDEIISVRVDSSLREQMRKHVHINWSAVLRKALIMEVSRLRVFDKKRAIDAAKNMDKIRASGVFNGGKTGTEIIREWRDKRR